VLRPRLPLGHREVRLQIVPRLYIATYAS
jgi:hypothetical protein